MRNIILMCAAMMLSTVLAPKDPVTVEQIKAAGITVGLKAPKEGEEQKVLTLVSSDGGLVFEKTFQIQTSEKIKNKTFRYMLTKQQVDEIIDLCKTPKTKLVNGDTVPHRVFVSHTSGDPTKRLVLEICGKEDGAIFIKDTDGYYVNNTKKSVGEDVQAILIFLNVFAEELEKERLSNKLLQLKLKYTEKGVTKDVKVTVDEPTASQIHYELQERARAVRNSKSSYSQKDQELAKYRCLVFGVDSENNKYKVELCFRYGKSGLSSNGHIYVKSITPDQDISPDDKIFSTRAQDYTLGITSGIISGQGLYLEQPSPKPQ